jgi:DNA-binding IclR family transcriptional regulator
MTAAKDERGPVVTALAHGLEILRLFSDERQVLSVSQIGREIGVHRSNASRLAATLHAMGFLRRVEVAGRYRLGPQLVRLGRLASLDNDVARQALGPLRRLVEETGETGHVGVLADRESVTIAVVDGWHTVRMHSYVNKRSPAYCSSMGKVMLAGLTDAQVRQRFPGRRLTALTPSSLSTVAALLRELARVRTLGYALDVEELEPGLCCVAAPIRDADGAVVACLGVSGPALRLTEAVLAELAVHVKAAAAQATLAIGGTP